MKLCGIICEFNPFTNGHEYIIKQAKEQTGLDILCLMSGNFVQRGEMAIINKYERAICSINAGASVNIELPICFSLSSAEKFAEGAIKSLMKLNCVSHLAFGVETANIKELEEIAKLKVKESQTVQSKIKQELKNGNNYNIALYNAFLSEYPEKSSILEEIFKSSNNILALEYLTAIYKLKANISPVYIRRLDNGYNSNKLFKTKINNKIISFGSASLIRQLITYGKLKTIKKLVPLYSYTQLCKLNKNKLNKVQTKLDTLIINSLLNETKESLICYHDYNIGLSSLISKASMSNSYTENIVNSVSSKTYRKSRIKKLLLFPLLKITQENFKKLENNFALNVLAVNKNNKTELSKIKKLSKVPLIISNKDYDELKDALSIDLIQHASNIYNLVNEKEIVKDKTLFV